MQSRKSVRYINLLFGILFGVLVFRLVLGPNYNYPALYTRFVWFVLFPIHILREYNNISISVLFYSLFWLYVLAVKIVVLNAPFGKTLLKTIMWMVLVSLPFIPFGVAYFSLALYMTTITSYLVRLLPFLALLVVLLLANRFYFNQRYIFAGIWTIVNFLLVVVVTTLSDLLPIIKSQIFFHALGYRLSIMNDFVSGSPLLAFLLVICLAVFYVFIFESQFLRLPFRRPSLISIITPAGILVALMLILVIMRDDFRRYRYFDYQGGIATVYFAKYDDRQVLSFDGTRITLSRSRYSVFYPFGKFNIRDTLRQHAADILRMKMIEGLDYYRLERISKIIAYGPRDDSISTGLRSVLDKQTHRLPEEFKSIAESIERRYSAPPNDIVVRGSVVINGRPLQYTEYLVNKITRVDRRAVEPIWQDKTDGQGGFRFTCYKDAELDSVYFQMIFLLPNKLIGKNMDYLKISNPVPVFSKSGTYLLDTVRLVVRVADKAVSFRELKIRTSSPVDSFVLYLPPTESGVAIHVTGSVPEPGVTDAVVFDRQPPLSDTLLLNDIMERLRGSRFYLKELPGTVEFQIN